MSSILTIQPNVYCEPCKECGSRPVIEEKRNGFSIICPLNKKHYQTKPGMIDIEGWNRINKKTPVIAVPQYKNKAS